MNRSNSLGELVDHLSRVVREPALGLFEPETIVIQSAGMERYLSRELSRRQGIVANVAFPYPRAFFRGVLDAALGQSEAALAFERESLAWVLYASLQEHAQGQERAFRGVRSYLEDDDDGSKRLLLAEKLANLFDQYVTYRPRMVLGWQKGQESENFQAILFRELCEKLGGAHFAARCKRLLNELSDDDLRRALPTRVNLMGGPGLPPLYLQMFARIGKVINCHVFSFSVCQEYFADAAQVAHLSSQAAHLSSHVEFSDEEQGTAGTYFPLLSSFGQVGADYQHLLLEAIGGYEDGGARFVSPHSDEKRPATVLTFLQQALIEGQEEPKDIARLRREVISRLDTDESLTLDSCHSPLREIEILHDRLLGWFAEDPTLRPEDVVVLAPQIEEYSPLISAVFAARAGETPKIPFRIADRSEKLINAAARAFLLSFSVLGGRFKASEVLDLLQLGPVRARYGIKGADLERIARWVSDANIRWGVDGEHRGEWGLPESDLYTFRFGLRRLLLGFALPDDGEQLWNDVVPLDEVAVSDLPLVGKLCEFCEHMFKLRERVAAAGHAGLSLDGWRVLLVDWMDAVLGESQAEGEGLDENWDTGAVRLSVHALLERAAAALLHAGLKAEQQTIGARSLFHLLEAELDTSRPSTDFLAGGVTFCALLPLRTIPFRAVCVLGLNQGEFPRIDSHFELDLIAKSPKRGDRSLRADDRYLFLEVLLAARERLALSYVGRSVQDNTEKPPSVVVTELSSAIEELIGNPAGAVPYLQPTEHPLQPFHPGYFKAPGALLRRKQIRSFDVRAFSGAEALCAEPQPTKPFFSDLPPASWEGVVELTLDQLVRFWKDPSQAFFDACGVRFSDDYQEVEDREPVVETGLGRYIVGDRLLSRKFHGKLMREDIELARGELPVGTGGRVLLRNVSEAAEEIFSLSARLRKGERCDPVPVTLKWAAPALKWEGLFADASLGLSDSSRVEELVLSGAISDLYGHSRLETSYGQLNTNRKLGLWIRHLAACAAGIELAHSALVVRGSARDGQGADVFVLRSIEQSRAHELLGNLCLLAVLGQREPLRFFPSASEAYFQALLSPPKKLEGDAIVLHAFDVARKVLLPNKSGRRPDVIVSELYRGSDPLGEFTEGSDEWPAADWLRNLPFACLAEGVFAPLNQAILEGSLAGLEVDA